MKPFELTPGVFSTPTKSSSSQNWADGHLVRWSGGSLYPMNGWSRINQSAFLSKPRKMHEWVDNRKRRHTAILCEGHLYVDSGDGFVNRSPTPAIMPPNNGSFGGYGDYLYNFGKYGTPRPFSQKTFIIPNMFSIDNWGEDLIFMSSDDGRLLRWSPPALGVAAQNAVVVPNAPTGRCFVVTPERHVIIFGHNNIFNEYAWSDQENIENWAYADVTSKAGFLPIEPSSPVISALTTDVGVLFFTTLRPYLITYKGLPFVYGHDPLPESPTPISPLSVCETPVGVVWMTPTGLWISNSNSISPLPCPMLDWMTDHINEASSKFVSFALHIAKKSEVWFFFPSGNNKENDRYLLWNYRESWWSCGYLNRTCGVASGYLDNHYMADEGFVYLHDTGWAYPGADLPWVLSHSINISDGSILSTLDRMFLDIEGNPQAAEFSLYYNMTRNGEEFSTTPRKVMNDGYIPFRTTARDFRLKVQSSNPSINGEWSLGKSMIDIISRGGR